MPYSSHALSKEELEFFHREGYLICESFIEPEQNSRLKADMDILMADRANHKQPLPISFPELGLLTSHPPMMDKLESIMGKEFAMHHIHSTRQDAGNPHVNWHQDYEQFPQSNRSHIMVHVFYYLNGLNGEIGDLLLVPRSQNSIISRRGLDIFGTEDLPGSLCVNNLPAGSAVIVHSGLFHARRAKPGGEGSPRYFTDISYCQRGPLWPSYHVTEQVNAIALENGLDRDGRYAHLYDSSQFFNLAEIHQKLQAVNEGSLALHLKDI